MHPHSRLLQITMGAVYPFIILFGIYIIVNGHKTPGGGFQGGAIISGIFIVHYFVNDEQAISLNFFNTLEKVLYMLILLFAILFIFQLRPWIPFPLKTTYLMVMNGLIGAKVTCGLSIIFYRFVLFESR